MSWSQDWAGLILYTYWGISDLEISLVCVWIFPHPALGGRSNMEVEAQYHHHPVSHQPIHFHTQLGSRYGSQFNYCRCYCKPVIHRVNYKVTYWHEGILGVSSHKFSQLVMINLTKISSCTILDSFAQVTNLLNVISVSGILVNWTVIEIPLSCFNRNLHPQDLCDLWTK